MRKQFVLIVLALMIVWGLSACGSSEQETTSSAAAVTPGSYTTVDVLTTFDALKASNGAQLVDVREPDEWTLTGVPVGAVLISLGELEQRAPDELAKERPVYVICRTGNRSRTGAEILLTLGYTEVYNVDGGIQAWMNAGLPVVEYAP